MSGKKRCADMLIERFGFVSNVEMMVLWITVVH